MPHSESGEPQLPDLDAMIIETETEDGETQATTQTLNGNADNADSQISNAVDQDMTMEDAGVEGEDVPQIKSGTNLDIKLDIKGEVKLEDLFADIESDDEFPSSIGQNVKVESSPEVPSSPV
jgi:DNA primase small subunit